MTMTTQDAIAATENIKEDILPGNKMLPNGQILSEDAQILLDKSIIAKPLGVMPSESINVRNPSFQYRWVNRLGANGSLYAKRRAQGWVPATPADAEPYSVEITSDNGEIRYGDSILMKIPRERYQQAMKGNMVRALQLQRDKKYLTNLRGDRAPSTDVFSDDSAVAHSVRESEASNAKGYVKTFEVSNEVLDSKMGPDKHAGRNK